MRMNKKRLLRMIGFCLLLLAGAPLCMAQESGEKEAVAVIDGASVLMEEEIDWLKEAAMDLAEDSGWTVVAVTCGDAGGRSAQEICGEYFTSYASGSDGICLLADTDGRAMEIAAMGAAKKYFSNRRIREILHEADEAFEKEDYAQCFFLMILGARKAYIQGEQNPLVTAGTVLAAIAVCAAAAFYVGHMQKLARKEGK